MRRGLGNVAVNVKLNRKMVRDSQVKNCRFRYWDIRIDDEEIQDGVRSSREVCWRVYWLLERV